MESLVAGALERPDPRDGNFRFGALAWLARRRLCLLGHYQQTSLGAWLTSA
jgi:hypothetical protein